MQPKTLLIVVVIVKIEQFVLMNLPYAPLMKNASQRAWNNSKSFNNRIPCSICIKGIFVSCFSLAWAFFSLSLSLFFTHSAVTVLGFRNGHDKTVYKTQSHSFSKLLIVTVIVAASSWQSQRRLRKIHLTAQDPKSHNEFVLDTSLMTIILMIVNTLSYQITSVLQSSPSFPFN